MPQRTQQVYVQRQRHKILKLLSKEWTIALLLALRTGQTFSELKWALGISPKSLSARLKELAAEELVAKIIYAEVPVRVEYQLTQRGTDLANILAALEAWEDM